MIIHALVLCTVGLTAAFHIPDFNIFEGSSTTMDKACSLLSSMIESITFNAPNIEHVLFELRTPCERIGFDVSEAGLLSELPEFDVNRKTVVIVTGWNSELTEPYTETLTTAYLCRDDHNIIVVDSSDYIKTEYIKSAYNTEKLGEFVAVGLKNLKIPGKNIHLIGHSLGAHIMGSAGRHFEAATNEQIGRITGLDPARPCFRAVPVFSRLGVGDAIFVDIIHSNPGETGTEEPIGDVDFYPGGLQHTKPGCSSINIVCSHIMSIDYYIESAYRDNEMNFMSSQCGNYTNLEEMDCHGSRTPMGFSADKSAKGIYLLAVNDKAPYGMNAKLDGHLKSDECGICDE